MKKYRLPLLPLVPLITGINVILAFLSSSDLLAAVVALMSEICIINSVLIYSPRIAAFRIFLYRTIVAIGFVWGVTSPHHFLFDFGLKLAAVILVAGLPAVLFFLAANSKKYMLNSCLALITIDLSIFYFFIPSTPSLLFLPFATSYLSFGGITFGIFIAITVWHLTALLVAMLINKPATVIKTWRVLIPLLIIAFPACSPIVSNELISIQASALHSNFEKNSILRQPVAQNAIAGAFGDLVVTPESFSPVPPDLMPPRLLQYLTARGQDVIVGSALYTGENYRGGAYHLRDGKVVRRHYKNYLFPTEVFLGAQKSNSPATDFEINELVVRPLICFEVVRPLRQFYKDEPPDIYVILSNTIDFPQAPRRVTRLLAQTLAATSHRPVIFAANGGESVIIAGNGKILTRAIGKNETTINAIL